MNTLKRMFFGFVILTSLGIALAVIVGGFTLAGSTATFDVFGHKSKVEIANIEANAEIEKEQIEWDGRVEISENETKADIIEAKESAKMFKYIASSALLLGMTITILWFIIQIMILSNPKPQQKRKRKKKNKGSNRRNELVIWSVVD